MRQFTQVFLFLFGSFLSLILGIVALFIPFSPSFRLAFASFFAKPSVTWFVLALFFLSLSSVLGALPFLLPRKKTLHLRSSPHPISVNLAVVEGYLKHLLGKIFPKKTVPFEASLQSGQIQIQVDLPSLLESEREILIEKIQKEMQVALYEKAEIEQDIQWFFSFEVIPK